MSKYSSNRLLSFVEGKCPRCQSGKIFTHPILHPKFREVHDNCPHCGVKFQSEPGFFWGAMYFSYAILVGLCIFVGVIFYTIYKEPPLFQTSGTIIGIVILLMPFNLRFSRLLLIYLAAPYRRFDKRTLH